MLLLLDQIDLLQSAILQIGHRRGCIVYIK